MNIEVEGITIGYGLDLETGAYKNKVLTDLSGSLRQGTITAIIGPHSSGKRTLIKVLSNILVPDQGGVFVPAHLRVLHMDRFPDFIVSRSLLENLTFGCVQEPSFQRVQAIVNDLVMTADGVKETMLLDIMLHEKNGNPLKDWIRMLTQTDFYIIHLARALIFNPEVLVMERLLGMFNADKILRILSVIRNHVDNRGLYEKESLFTRRPRTVAFVTMNSLSSENVLEGEKELAIQDFPSEIDAIWKLDMEGQCDVTDRHPEHKV